MDLWLICCRVAIMKRLSRYLFSFFSEIYWVAHIVAKLNIHVLKSIIDSIMTLKCQKSRGSCHGAHWAYELISAACIKKLARSLSVDFNLNLLNH